MRGMIMIENENKLLRMSRKICFLLLMLSLLFSVSCQQQSARTRAADRVRLSDAQVKPLPANAPPALARMIEGAKEQTEQTFYYDPAYVKLDYPGGDVPLERGVCTDVVVRAFRKGGVDLQKEVHEDMKRAFSVYPTKWGLTKPDANIDHRRVPNLQKYFERRGKSLPITQKASNYQPGDVVAWDVGGLDHIGLVTNLWLPEAQQFLIVHNIGGGARIENALFSWQITGHYRYF
jgi:uncharacterized protein YijF (DUF1287 family)